jgi:hypothetical protein
MVVFMSMLLIVVVNAGAKPYPASNWRAGIAARNASSATQAP